MDGSQAHDEPALVARLLGRLIADRRSGTLAPLAQYEALHPGCEEMVRRIYAQIAGSDAPSPVVPATSPSPPSDSKIGRFRILGELGRGGQAIVYRAEDSTLRRTVALKVLTIGAQLSETALRRFRREAEIASRLDHPGICPVYDTGVDGGLTWIAMRCVEGEPLARRIAAARRSEGRDPVISESRSEKPPTATPSPSTTARAHALRVISFMEKVARTLHAAHEAGVVHRDVKPGNIMVLPDGEPVVLDFGLARSDDAAATAVTQTGDFLGTPSYMAPEQLAGPTELVDRRADVWGLGVTLYESLTLERPFEDSTRGGLEDAIRSRDPGRVHRANSQVPRDLDAIVEKALEKNPRRRYATAAELAEDLHRVRVHEPVRARPAGPLLRTQRWVQRNPVAAALILVLVAGLATALTLLKQIQTRESETQTALRHTRAMALAQRSAEVVQNDPRLALRFALASLDIEPTLVDAISEVHHAIALDHPGFEIHNSGWVHSVEVSSDGRQLLTASDDRTARIWDLSDGHEVRRFEGHTQGLQSASWSPDRGLIVTCSADGAARIFRSDGTERAKLLHGAPLQTAVFSPDGSRILTGCDDGFFRLWNLEGQKLAENKAHDGPVHAAFSADNSRILTYPASMSFNRGFLDFSAHMWTVDAKPVGDPMKHDEQIQFAAFSPSGHRVITCSLDKTAVLWDPDGHELHKLAGHTGPVMYAAFSHDGDRVVTCSLDCTARVWDVSSGRCLCQLPSHGHLVWAATYSPNDDMILTASADQQAHLSTPDGYLIDILRGHKRGEVLRSIVFLPETDGPPRMLTASQDGTVRIWDAWSAQLPVFSGHHGMAVSSAFSPDGSRIATGGQGVVRLWQRDGKLLRELHAGFGTVDAVAFSPDGRHLAAGTWDRRLVIWDLDAGGEPASALLGGPVWGVQFFPDQPLLMVASLEGPVSLWTANAKRVRSFTKGPEALRAALSPDGQSVLTGHDDGVARLWDLDGNLKQAFFPGHHGRISSVSFHPNGREVLTSGMDGKVIRWDLAAHPLSRMIGPENVVNWAAFAPDGGTIASAHNDGMARLWSLDGRMLVQLPGHTARIHHIVYSPDGSRLLTSSADGTCRTWFAHTSDLLAYAHQVDSGRFSDEDRLHFADLLGAKSESAETGIAEADDADVCNSVAWSMVEPGAGANRIDPARAVTLAERAAALTQRQNPEVLQTLGLAFCRVGRHREAVTTLEDVEALRMKASTPRSAVDFAFLAIAQHELRRDAEARAALDTSRGLFRTAPDERSAREAIAEAELALGLRAHPEVKGH